MLVRVFICFLILGLVHPLLTKAEETGPVYCIETRHGAFRLSKSESYVFDRVKQGRAADLSAEFGDDTTSRKLRSDFLRFLITDKLYDTQHDLVINGAIIDGPLAITSEDVALNIALTNCVFHSYISLRNSHFRGYLQLTNTNFHGDMDLNSLKVDGNLNIENAIFSRGLDLAGGNIGGQLLADSAYFESVDALTTFNGLVIGKDSFFRKAHFRGPVEFTKAQFRKDFVADNVAFTSDHSKVTFDSISVAGSFSLSSANFKCPANFAAMDIGNAFVCRETSFLNKDVLLFTLLRCKFAIFSGTLFKCPVDFSLSSVEDTLIINVPIKKSGKQGTVFKRDVSFNGASIGKFLICTRTQFQSNASLKGVKVGISASFEESIFKGQVDFTTANFGNGGLIFNGAQFLSHEAMVSFNSIRVSGNAIFMNAKFLGPVDFTSANIEGGIGFQDSKFLNQDVYIHFTLMRVGQTAVFDKVEFKASPNFSGAYFREDFYAQDAHFENSITSCDFNGSRVGQTLTFENAIFTSKADFTNADIGGSLIAAGIRLLTKDQSMVFSRVKVGGDISIQNSIFEGLVNFEGAQLKRNIDAFNVTFKSGLLFRHATVDGNVFANESKYLGKDMVTSFNGSSINGCVFLMSALFEGPVDFITGKIGGQLLLENAHFLTEQKVTFNGMRVGDGVFLHGAEFNGFVDFRTAEIKSNFEADGAKFFGKDRACDFSSMSVGRSVILNDSEFSGGVDFYGSSIGMDFSANATKFLDSKSDVVLNNIRVRNGCNFIRSTFGSGLVIKQGHLGSLLISDDELNNAEPPHYISRLDLHGVTVERELIIRNVQINSMNAKGLQALALLSLDGTKIRDICDLTNGKVGTCELRNVTFPKKTRPEDEFIYLTNFDYGTISLEKGDQRDKYEELIELLNNSQFDVQNYKQMANYFDKKGYADRASEIIKIGERLNAQRMPWYQRYPYEYVWGMFTGYGRDVRYSVLGVLGFILFGISVFDPKHLKREGHNEWRWLIHSGERNRGQRATIASIMTRLVISVDQFIPGSPLGVSKSWEVSRARYRHFIYYTLHKILGWIMVPLILVALYTRVK